MQLTSLMLVDFCKKALAQKAKYWYGTFWLPATTSLYNSKKSQYPSHYGSSRTAEYKRQIKEGAMVVDCAGLIKGFFWSENGTLASKYASNFPDANADGIIANYCEQTGAIKSIPETPGLVVWSSGHIGVYIGGGQVIEARGFAYGVVKTEISKRSWTKWGMLKSKYLSYVSGSVPVEDDPPEYELGERTLKKGDRGADVKQLQQILISLNFSCGVWGADGDFGSMTQSAVTAFQFQYGLPETGVVDEDDFAKIARLTDPENPDGDGDAGDGDAGDSGDPDAAPKYVRVTQGNTVNIRRCPSATAPILGIAHLGDSFAYTGTSTDEWHEIEFMSEIAWITKKYTAVEDSTGSSNPPASGSEPDVSKVVIVDVSQHNGLKASGNDWGKIKANVDLLILRCGVTRTETKPIGIGVDAEFEYAAKKCQAFGIPFGVYYYGKVKTAAEARKEADMAFDTATPYKPLFYAYDVEEGRLTNACITAWADQIRKRGANKIGMYIGHNYYTKHKATVSAFDFIWIPRYGKNDGSYDPKYAPAYPCDIHQYTSVGKVAGFADKTADINRLTGSKPLSWFLERGVADAGVH